MMKRAGGMLLVIGVLSYAAPLFGMQFRLVSLFGGGPWVGAVFIGVGAVMLVISAGFSAIRRTPAPRIPVAPPPASAAPVRPAPPRIAPEGGSMCGQCGRALPRGAAFCPICGAAVARRTTAAPPAQQYSVQAYPPPTAPPHQAGPSRGPRVVAATLFCLGVVAVGYVWLKDPGGWKQSLKNVLPATPATAARPTPIPPVLSAVRPAPPLGSSANSTVERVWLENDVVSGGEVGSNVHARLANPGGQVAYCCIYVQQPRGAVAAADSRFRDAGGNLAIVMPANVGTSGSTAGQVTAFFPNAAIAPGGDSVLALQPVLYDSQWHELSRSGAGASLRRESSYFTRIAAGRAASAQGLGRPGLEVTVGVVFSPVNGRAGKLVAHFFPAGGNRPLSGMRPYADSAGNLCATTDFQCPQSAAQIDGVKVAIPMEALENLPAVRAEVSLFDPVIMQYVTRPVSLDVKLAP